MILQLTLAGGNPVWVNLATVLYWTPSTSSNLENGFEIWFSEDTYITIRENPSEVLSQLQRRAQFQPGPVQQ